MSLRVDELKRIWRQLGEQFLVLWQGSLKEMSIEEQVIILNAATTIKVVFEEQLIPVAMRLDGNPACLQQGEVGN